MPLHLIVFQDLNHDSVVQAVAAGEEAAALRQLIPFAEEQSIHGAVWGHYLCRLLAQADNVFSRTVEQTGDCGRSLRGIVQADLERVLELLEMGPAILRAYEPSAAGSAGLHPRRHVSACEAVYRQSLVAMEQAMATGARALYDHLVGHYATLGRGISAQYPALAWAGHLVGVQSFDPIRLDELIGIDHQKRTLIENTERFLRGAGANNVLLFGDSGTGKSSSVKALVNQYCLDGLRLIELTKHQLDDLEQVVLQLARSRHRYLIFLDDLSFEDGELGYKRLKAALEGKATVTPDNVLFYATSNRRHLIRESWSDRVTQDDEVHLADTIQEKMSLSDRFGLRVVFPSPSQQTYLAIVESYLQRLGMPFSESLRAQALQWELTYNGRSGRTARQFVQSLAKISLP